MKKPNVNTLKKYLNAMNKIKAKYITAERLSRVIGVYPEVIKEKNSKYKYQKTLIDLFCLFSSEFSIFIFNNIF